MDRIGARYRPILKVQDSESYQQWKSVTILYIKYNILYTIPVYVRTNKHAFDCHRVLEYFRGLKILLGYLWKRKGHGVRDHCERPSTVRDHLTVLWVTLNETLKRLFCDRKQSRTRHCRTVGYCAIQSPPGKEALEQTISFGTCSIK